MASEAKIIIKLQDQFSETAKKFSEIINKITKQATLSTKSFYEQGTKASEGAMTQAKASIVATQKEIMQKESNLKQKILQDDSSHKQTLLKNESLFRQNLAKVRENWNREDRMKDKEATRQARLPILEKESALKQNRADEKHKLQMKQMKQNGQYASFITAGVVLYSGMNIVKQGADMERGKTEIDKVVRGEEAKMRPVYYKIAESLVRQFGISIEEAYAQVGRTYKFAGTPEATKNLVIATIAGTKIFDTTTIESSEAIASIQSKFNLNNAEIPYVMSLINDYANSLGAVKDKKLFAVLKRLPTIQGLTLDDAALFASIGIQSTNMEASGVSTAQNKVLTKIQKKDGGEKDFSFFKWFEENAEKFQKMNEVEKSKFLKKYKINETRETNFIKGVFRVFEQNMQDPNSEGNKQYKALFDQYKQYTYFRMQNNEGKKMELERGTNILNNQIIPALTDNETYAIYTEQIKLIFKEMGSAFIQNALKPNMESFSKTIESFQGFIKENDKLTADILTLTLGFAGAGLAIRGLLFALAPFLSGIGALVGGAVLGLYGLDKFVNFVSEKNQKWYSENKEALDKDETISKYFPRVPSLGRKYSPHPFFGDKYAEGENMSLQQPNYANFLPETQPNMNVETSSKLDITISVPQGVSVDKVESENQYTKANGMPVPTNPFDINVGLKRLDK